MHTEQGDHRDALDIGRQVPADPGSARQARFMARRLDAAPGRHQEAFNAFSDLNRAGRDPALLNNLGVVQLRRPAGVDRAAVPCRTSARRSQLDAADSDLFFNLGYAFWLDQRPARAPSWLREAVRRNPADDAAHYVLGVALQASGSAAEAAREKELARQLSSMYAEWEAKQPGATGAPRGLER